MRAALLNKGVDTFERVQNSELSGKITEMKLRKLQQTKLYITSFEFTSFGVFTVSFFFLFAISRTRHLTRVSRLKKL